MDQFPSNSQTPKKNEPESDEKREKLQKIVTGKVIQRDKPLSKRFMDTFFSGTSSVWGYILHDVLIPAAKDVIADVVTQGAERALFGEARSSSRRTGARPGGSQNYVSYNRFAQPTQRREEPRTLSHRARASHDFKEIILESRGHVEVVLDQLFNLISQYDQATVSDLYDLVGIQSTFADERWGWRDLRGARPHRVTGGYLLDLPKPEPLD